MAGRFDKEFAYTPIGTVEPNGQQVQWELINIFRYTDEGRLVHAGQAPHLPSRGVQRERGLERQTR